VDITLDQRDACLPTNRCSILSVSLAMGSFSTVIVWPDQAKHVAQWLTY
jgi:hypothetical protein